VLLNGVKICCVVVYTLLMSSSSCPVVIVDLIHSVNVEITIGDVILIWFVESIGGEVCAVIMCGYKVAVVSLWFSS